MFEAAIMFYKRTNEYNPLLSIGSKFYGKPCKDCI